MIIGRIADHVIGSKTYYVYVVGDESDSSMKALMTAAADATYASLPGDIAVKTEQRDDNGDPQQAEAISKELAQKPDTLMVVGHGYTTTSKSALPNYLSADPPIPVILTTETNPNLVPSTPSRPGDDSVPPVFRLFPTDDSQAEVAARFIAGQHAKKVWVVQDTGNPVYSEYLTRQFLKAAYEEQPELNVILWSNNLNLPPYSVDKLGIDWVFFAGEWTNALVLIRQLNALPGNNKPKVLLSDGSADKLLLKYGQSDVENVYLLHPLSADEFTKSEYRVVGEEASMMTKEIVSDVQEQFDSLATEAAPVSYRFRKWLGLHRVTDARRAVARYMSVAANKGTSLKTDPPITMMRAQDTGAVIRKDAKFHIWQVQNNKFVQIQ
jgi:branched-chain amino acid transport system substrate-binding protein